MCLSPAVAVLFDSPRVLKLREVSDAENEYKHDTLSKALYGQRHNPD